MRKACGKLISLFKNNEEYFINIWLYFLCTQAKAFQARNVLETKKKTKRKNVTIC